MDKQTTPQPFTAHHIRFEVEALTPLLLPAHPGPSIRGALWGALRHHFCPAPPGASPGADHKALCPVCWLMDTEKPGGPRGRNIPRPYAVEPPLCPAGDPARATWFDPGQRFRFGLTLYSEALNLFPYLVVALPILGQTGLGVPLAENGDRAGQKRRGRLKLCRVEAVNPVTGEVAPVMGEGQTTVHFPDAPATQADVEALAAAMLDRIAGHGVLVLRCLTPTRIVEGERLVKRPWLGPLIRRLLERLDALRGEYAGQPPWPDRQRLSDLADRVQLVDDCTRWQEVRSRSRRLGRSTWVSGYVGRAAYRAARDTWAALLPLLLWGQATHVGKNATKGNGWYRLEETM